MPAVSVIMPSYNHAAFIAEAIESVLAQSLTDLELIVIDDGSSDGTQDIIRGFSDPRIRTVFRERNIGSAQGSNEGLRLARSPLIAMISSDDAFTPHKLERQMRLMQEDRSMIAVFCRPRIVDAHGQEHGPGTERLRDTFVAGRWSQVDLTRRLFFNGNFLCHPSAMVRREIFDRVGHYDVRLNSLGDFDMWTRIAVAMPGDFVVLDEPLMSFRVHATNTSGLTLGNLRCGENEWPLVIGRFGNLKARPDIFAAAFPEVREQLQGSPVDFDYALALLALRHHVRSVRGFGVRQLYQLMGDEAAADRLATVHGFTTRELIRTSKETDTAGVAAPKSHRTSARVTRELRRLTRQLSSLVATAVTPLGPSDP